jgi:4-hydroxy-tetrahydrodipicolinate reductase
MGQRLAALCAGTDDIEVVGAVESGESPCLGSDLGQVATGEPSGARVWPVEDMESAVRETGAEILVDFSNAIASTANIARASRMGLGIVMGTTGHDDEQMNSILKSISDNGVPAVISPNMSAGVNVMIELCRSAVGMLPDYDVEIFEIHHNRKVDAPSGTALKIAEEISAASEPRRTILTGRSGEGRRQRGEIGVSSARGGDVVGDHTVIFAGSGERIEITHRAQSRDAFANGVLASIRFVSSSEPGVYSIRDVLKSM